MHTTPSPGSRDGLPSPPGLSPDDAWHCTVHSTSPRTDVTLTSEAPAGPGTLYPLSIQGRELYAPHLSSGSGPSVTEGKAVAGCCHTERVVCSLWLPAPVDTVQNKHPSWPQLTPGAATDIWRQCVMRSERVIGRARAQTTSLKSFDGWGGHNIPNKTLSGSSHLVKFKFKNLLQEISIEPR